MKRLLGVAGLLILGAALGAGGALAWLTWPEGLWQERKPLLSHFDDMPEAQFARQDPRQLAREKFAPRADEVIAARQFHHTTYFYSTPFRRGRGLCEVDTITTIRSLNRQLTYSIGPRYGFVGRTTGSSGPDLDPHACERYRDFAHLFEASDMFTARRGAELLEQAMRDTRAGKFAFRLTCIDRPRRGGGEIECDGRAMLAGVDRKAITRIDDAGVRQMPDGSEEHIDTLVATQYLRPDNDFPALDTAITIHSIRPPNSVEPRITKIEVSRGVDA